MSQSKRTQRKKARSTAADRRPAAIILLVVGLGLAALAVFFALRGTSTGTPNLAIDRETIDFGDVSFEKAVTAEFTLTNTGDAPLQIKEKPYVEVKEGC